MWTKVFVNFPLDAKSFQNSTQNPCYIGLLHIATAKFQKKRRTKLQARIQPLRIFFIVLCTDNIRDLQYSHVER